jgi:hypothetical protein
MFEYAGQDNGTLGVTTSEVASRLGVTEAAIGKRRTPILTGRYSRVVAFEPSWINEGMARATVVIEYYDTNRVVEEGEGTYWLPVELSGSFRKRQRAAQKIAETVARGIARQYALERGHSPDRH